MSRPGGLFLFLGAALLGAVGSLLALRWVGEGADAPAPMPPAGALTEDTVDAAVWGRWFPRQYESWRRAVDAERTRFGGSEAYHKLEDDPRWRVLFEGYPFGADYREERGHAFMLEDQESSERVRQFRQPGACLQCHASALPLYRERGREAGVADGPEQVRRGAEIVGALPYEEARALVQHPVSCVDCHDPTSLALRATRPAFLAAVADLARSDDPLPQYPSIGAWRAAGRRGAYDPNRAASRQEMRVFVCAQCHAEYAFEGEETRLFHPWARGLGLEALESVYEAGGHRDWVHPRTGAPVLKAQHPEFELWSQGTHSRRGVACADCHMPARRVGAQTVSDHHVRSPLLDPAASCLPCHEGGADELRTLAEAAQLRTRGLLDRAEVAVLALIEAYEGAAEAGAGREALAAARALHRRAQWRLDFVAAENSQGFHAAPEAARILAEAIDYARQGEIEALRARPAGR